jgi:hypothetical protein
MNVENVTVNPNILGAVVEILECAHHTTPQLGVSERDRNNQSSASSRLIS